MNALTKKLYIIALLALSCQQVVASQKLEKTELSKSAETKHTAEADAWEKEDQFIQAAKNEDINRLTVLLDRGADIESGKTKWGDTALIIAAKKNNTAMIKMLLQRGADVNYKNCQYESALGIACIKHNVEAAEELLKCQNIDLKMNNGTMGRPLLISVLLYNEKIKDAFLEKKNAQEVMLDTLSHKGNNLSSFYLNRLLKHYDIENCDHMGRTALMIAAHKGRSYLFYDLLEFGANIQAQDSFNKNALHLIASQTNLDNGHLTIANTIIDHKNGLSMVNVQTTHGDTPFMLAAENGKNQLCEILYKAGADPSVDYFGRNAFSLANSYVVKQGCKDLSLPTRVLEMIVHHEKRKKPLKQLLNSYLPEENVKNLIANYEFEDSQEKKQEVENLNS